MEISFNELRKVQLQERKLGSLTKLHEGFYADYSNFLGGLRGEAATGGMESIKILENASSVLENIVELRQQKILFKALKDLRSGNVGSDGLANEEKELYTSLVKLINGFDKQLLDGVRGERVQAPKQKETVSVKILAALPQFVGPDAQNYGPFSEGQVVELKREAAQLLVKRNAAIATEVV